MFAMHQVCEFQWELAPEYAIALPSSRKANVLATPLH